MIKPCQSCPGLSGPSLGGQANSIRLVTGEFRGKIPRLRLGISIKRIAKVWSERQIT